MLLGVSMCCVRCFSEVSRFFFFVGGIVCLMVFGDFKWELFEVDGKG